jgi:hypothetical protein
LQVLETLAEQVLLLRTFKHLTVNLNHHLTRTPDRSSRLFAKAGYSVALIARTESSLKKLSDEINANGRNVQPIFFY